MRFYTALDWSGDPGDPTKPSVYDPFLVLAAIHVAAEDVAILQQVVAEANRALRQPDRRPFKHVGASARARQVFFEAVGRAPFAAHVLFIDKRRWGDAERVLTGEQRLRDSICRLVAAMPDEVVAEQRLLIDRPRTELQSVRDIGTAIRQTLRANGRASFKAVKPCPDAPDPMGVLVQVADMIAGQIHEFGGTTTGPVRSIAARLRVIET